MQMVPYKVGKVYIRSVLYCSNSSCINLVSRHKRVEDDHAHGAHGEESTSSEAVSMVGVGLI